jgi:hypothetical protein
MLDKGLHNGKTFDGNLSAKYSSSKKGLISPITSMSNKGFTDQEMITLLKNNGFDSNLTVDELYLDPFDSSILLDNGNMSTASDEEKARFRRILLSNVIINSVTMASPNDYTLLKSDLSDFFNTVYSIGFEGEGGPESTTILKFLISLGNDVLSNDNLGSLSKVRARIFVTVSEYVSNRIKKVIIDDGNLIYAFESIISELFICRFCTRG